MVSNPRWKIIIRWRGKNRYEVCEKCTRKCRAVNFQRMCNSSFISTIVASIIRNCTVTVSVIMYYLCIILFRTQPGIVFSRVTRPRDFDLIFHALLFDKLNSNTSSFRSGLFFTREERMVQGWSESTGESWSILSRSGPAEALSSFETRNRPVFPASETDIHFSAGNDGNACRTDVPRRGKIFEMSPFPGGGKFMTLVDIKVT